MLEAQSCSRLQTFETLIRLKTCQESRNLCSQRELQDSLRFSHLETSLLIKRPRAGTNSHASMMFVHAQCHILALEEAKGSQIALT